MGNTPVAGSRKLSSQSALITVVSGTAVEPPQSVHPDIERLESIERFEPLASRKRTFSSALKQVNPSQELVDPRTLIEVTNAIKQEAWNTQRVVAESQSSVIEEINAIEKKVESLMNKTGNHVSASQDFFHHMKNLGKINKDLEDCYSSFQGAVIGLEALYRILQAAENPELLGDLVSPTKYLGRTKPVDVKSEESKSI